MLYVLCNIDQWDAQATVKRINESLIERGYMTWFDLTNMKGELTFHRLPVLHFFLALELFDLYKHRAWMHRW